MSLRILLAGVVLVALTGAASAQGTCRFEEGTAAFNAGQTAAAIDAWLPCAQNGDAEAQYYLGLAYVSAGEADKAKSWLAIAIAEGRLWSQPPPRLETAIGMLEYIQ